MLLLLKKLTVISRPRIPWRRAGGDQVAALAGRPGSHRPAEGGGKFSNQHLLGAKYCGPVAVIVALAWYFYANADGGHRRACSKEILTPASGWLFIAHQIEMLNARPALTCVRASSGIGREARMSAVWRAAREKMSWRGGAKSHV